MFYVHLFHKVMLHDAYPVTAPTYQYSLQFIFTSPLCSLTNFSPHYHIK
jgi:hypothetical protein